MSAYTDGLNEAAENAFCDLTRAGVAAGLIFGVVTASTLAGSIAGLAAAGISAHLYASYCGRPPPPSPYGTPPDFTGGQCDDVEYRIAITFMLIQDPKTNPINIGRTGAVYYGYGPVTSAGIRYTGDVDNALYTYASWKGGSADNIAVQGTRFDANNPEYGYTDPIIQVRRSDNQPDLCGNPPDNPPADRFEEPGNITYINREGDTINNPVTFDFRGARIGLNGDVFIPVNVRFNLDPTLNFSANLNINSGNVTVNPRGDGTPVGNGDDPRNVYIPPGAPPTTPPGVPPDPPPPIDPEEPTDPPLIIRGVIVTTTQNDSKATVIFQGAAPDIFAPSLGHVAFLCLVNDVYCWSSDIPVKNRKQIIQCPWKYGAVDVRATPQPGASFEISKVYDVSSLSG